MRYLPILNIQVSPWLTQFTLHTYSFAYLVCFRREPTLPGTHAPSRSIHSKVELSSRVHLYVKMMIKNTLGLIRWKYYFSASLNLNHMLIMMLTQYLLNRVIFVCRFGAMVTWKYLLLFGSLDLLGRPFQEMWDN